MGAQRKEGAPQEKRKWRNEIGRNSNFGRHFSFPILAWPGANRVAVIALGRSRGGFTTKIHARCDTQGRPLGFVLTPGQAHDTQGFLTLLHMVEGGIAALLVDKGYDSDAIRDELAVHGIKAVIPSRANLRLPRAFDRDAYKGRNRIERMFNKRKNWRQVATQYDKTAPLSWPPSLSLQLNSEYPLSTQPRRLCDSSGHANLTVLAKCACAELR